MKHRWMLVLPLLAMGAAPHTAEPPTPAEIEFAREELVFVKKRLLEVRMELRTLKVEVETNRRLPVDEKTLEARLEKCPEYQVVLKEMADVKRMLEVTAPSNRPPYVRQKQTRTEQLNKAVRAKMTEAIQADRDAEMGRQITKLERLETVLHREMLRLHRLAGTSTPMDRLEKDVERLKEEVKRLSAKP